MDTENRLRRAGKLPKDKKEVIVGDEKLGAEVQGAGDRRDQQD